MSIDTAVRTASAAMKEGFSEEKNSLASSNPPQPFLHLPGLRPACTPQHPSFAPFILVLISSADPSVFAALVRTPGA